MPTDDEVPASHMDFLALFLSVAALVTIWIVTIAMIGVCNDWSEKAIANPPSIGALNADCCKHSSGTTAPSP